MSAERITVIGIRPKANSIGPAGSHLRWMFAPHLGFPNQGFRIYRRQSDDFKPDHCLELSKIQNNQLLSSGSELEGTHLYYPDAVQVRGSGQAFLEINPTSPGLLELRFPEPVVHVRLDISQVRGPLRLRAYAGQRLVAESSNIAGNPGQSGSIEVTAPYITRATLPLEFRRLHNICFLSEAAGCKDPGWQ